VEPVTLAGFDLTLYLSQLPPELPPLPIPLLKKVYPRVDLIAFAGYDLVALSLQLPPALLRLSFVLIPVRSHYSCSSPALLLFDVYFEVKPILPPIVVF
jgi:hypothetical protein